jgi:hypothetical protein
LWVRRAIGAHRRQLRTLAGRAQDERCSTSIYLCSTPRLLTASIEPKVEVEPRLGVANWHSRRASGDSQDVARHRTDRIHVCIRNSKVSAARDNQGYLLTGGIRGRIREDVQGYGGRGGGQAGSQRTGDQKEDSAGYPYSRQG